MDTSLKEILGKSALAFAKSVRPLMSEIKF
jgi:hypothetical protein